MRVESLSAIAGNQRELHKEVTKILKDSEYVFFIKENITIREVDLHLLNCLAEFELEMMKIRQCSGRAKARANGVHIGRPGLSDEKIAEIKKRRLLGGESARSVSESMDIGIVTIYKYS